MKVGPRHCIFILFLISLAKGISFTPSVDFFFHDHVVVVVAAANPFEFEEEGEEWLCGQGSWWFAALS